MTHFLCAGSCQKTYEEEGVCLTEGCDKQYELLENCDCEDGQHGMNVVTKDSNGTILQNGDDVYLIKDLTVRGTSKTFKRGTVAKNIRLTDNPEEVDCKLEGAAIVLRTEFLKKKS